MTRIQMFSQTDQRTKPCQGGVALGGQNRDENHAFTHGLEPREVVK